MLRRWQNILMWCEERLVLEECIGMVVEGPFQLQPAQGGNASSARLARQTCQLEHC
jgi:hypothetical protein